MQNTLYENGFIMPAFHTYGGKEGYNDIGPVGTIVKQKFLQLWREEFLRKEQIDEIECPIIMPYDLLKKSGHVDKFTDYVITDKNGICHRADHIVQDFSDHNKLDLNTDAMTPDEMFNVIKQNNLLELGSKSNSVVEKNLMFQVDKDCFLRPELAQGIFVNSYRYKQQMRKKLPFGLAQIGRSYRKEISPKPFLRMREFFQAEIEFFYNPNEPIHVSKLKDFDEYKLPLLRNGSLLELISVKDIREQKIISNDYLLYFMAKINNFMQLVGIKKNYRFRQHNPNEMAHYARDCWDVECNIDGKWVECIGCADRDCYDLKAHGIQFQSPLTEPILKEELEIIFDKKLLGKKFKNNSNEIYQYVDNLTHEEKLDMMEDINCGIDVLVNDKHLITPDLITKSKIAEKKVYEENFYPCVIEPSFGIDRILYAIYYNSFWCRKDDINKTVLSLPANLAPYDIALLFKCIKL